MVKSALRKINRVSRIKSMKMMRVTACFCIMLVIGISVYAISMLQTSIKFTRRGFKVGESQPNNISISSNDIPLERGEQIETVTVEKEGVVFSF